MQIDAILDADLDDVQQAVVESARSYFTAAFPSTAVRALVDSATGYPDTFTADWAGMDWHRLLVDEDLAGAGLGARELCLLAREAAASMAPTPFVPAALTTWLLVRVAPDAEVTRDLLSGERRATLSVPEETGEPLTAGPGGLRGERTMVPYALGVDHLIVTAAGNGAAPLAYLVAPELGMIGERTPRFDLTRRWHTLRFDGATAERLGTDPADVARIGHLATLAAAADSAGTARRALDMAVEYARAREQFGRPIGTYQGVSHRCARMLYDLQAAWTLIWAAAEALDAGAAEDSVERAVAMAKAHASDAGTAITNAALQVHGGIGFSAEHDSHLLLRRTLTDAQTWRSARSHRATALYHLLDVDPTAGRLVATKTEVPATA